MKFEHLTEKKKQLDHYRPLPSDLVRNLDDWFRIELTYTSNAIEGNTLTRQETALIVEKGLTVGGLRKSVIPFEKSEKNCKQGKSSGSCVSKEGGDQSNPENKELLFLNEFNARSKTVNSYWKSNAAATIEQLTS